MNIKIRHLFLVFMIICLSVIPLQGNAVIAEPEIVDYTAYPAFTTNVVAPNILLVLDMSGSMQFPAYIGEDYSGYSSKVANCNDNYVSGSWDYSVIRPSKLISEFIGIMNVYVNWLSSH